MKNTAYKLIVTVLVLVIVLGCAGLLYQRLGDQVSVSDLPTQATTQESRETGATNVLDLAPNFTVVDADCNEHSLSDYLGRPVVLNFWATWCGPCQMEMPEFDKAYQEYGDQIQFMMINLTDGYSDTVKSASDFVQEGGYAFPVFFDTSTQAAVNYEIYSIPVTPVLCSPLIVISANAGTQIKSIPEGAT